MSAILRVHRVGSGLAAGVAISLSCLSAAQPATGRAFTYRATDLVDQAYAAGTNPTLRVASKVEVQPYLYIAGNLGASWQVAGWGAATDVRSESIKFYHNETLTLTLARFADLTKTNGTRTGARNIGMKLRMSFANHATNASVFDTGTIAASAINQVFTPSTPQFTAAQTGGLMRLTLTRTIDVRPDVGPGTYENAGEITVGRN